MDRLLGQAVMVVVAGNRARNVMIACFLKLHDISSVTDEYSIKYLPDRQSRSAHLFWRAESVPCTRARNVLDPVPAPRDSFPRGQCLGHS